MIIIPKERPVVQNLNSYYINIDKFFEHYQGELGTGGIYFKSSASEGAVFFDENDLFAGCYYDKEVIVNGQKAIEKLIEDVSKNSYFITVYDIGIDNIYFWANLSNAETIYNDLSSEFTDVEALIKKMNSEKLIGYIEINLNGGKGTGLILFKNGEIIGSSFLGKKAELNDSKSDVQDFLIKKTREIGGLFKVKKISLAKNIKNIDKPNIKHPVVSLPKQKPKIQEPPIPFTDMVTQLLSACEKSLYEVNKKFKSEFDTILKKKFIEKSDKYYFLDPFAAEFQYINGNVKIQKKIDGIKLVRGIWECVKEIVRELNISKKFEEDIISWKKKFSNELSKIGIKD